MLHYCWLYTSFILLMLLCIMYVQMWHFVWNVQDFKKSPLFFFLNRNLILKAKNTLSQSIQFNTHTVMEGKLRYYLVVFTYFEFELQICIFPSNFTVCHSLQLSISPLFLLYALWPLVCSTEFICTAASEFNGASIHTVEKSGAGLSWSSFSYRFWLF